MDVGSYFESADGSYIYRTAEKARSSCSGSLVLLFFVRLPDARVSRQELHTAAGRGRAKPCLACAFAVILFSFEWVMFLLFLSIRLILLILLIL